MAAEIALHAAAMMGTLVSIQVRGRGTETREARMRGAERALEWFHHVEHALSRFDAQS